MADVLTYNNLISIFQDIQSRHYQLQGGTFFAGGLMADTEALKNSSHPVLWVKPIDGQLIRNDEAGFYPVKTLTFEVYAADLLNTSYDNREDVTSDMHQALTDVVNELSSHPFYQRSQLALDGDVSMEPLLEWNDRGAYGWKATVKFKVKNPYDFCGLPLEDITGFSFPGLGLSSYTFNSPFVTCANLTGCSSLTDYIDNFFTSLSGFTNVLGGTNVFVDGTVSSPKVNVTGATLDNLDVSGLTSFVIFSAGTAYITNLFGMSPLNIQGHLTVEDTLTRDASFSATTLSGGSIFSGSTDLSFIFQTISADNNDITRVQPGTNTVTGGTGNNPTVNLVASPSINGLTFSGTAIGNNFSANTISGGTIFSGSTPLQTIIQNLIPADQNDITRVQPGRNILTGGTANDPTVNLVDSPSVNNLTASGLTLSNTFSANTVSGGTFFSGSTPLQTIIQNLIPADQNDITRVQPGVNILTGGTGNNPTVNLVASPSVNNLTASGLTLSNTFSSNTVSGSSIFSGSTDLSFIFQPIGGSSGDVTRVQPGTNTVTGGTDNLPTVNLVDNPSINGLTFSGSAIGNTLSANTVSGGTFFSGSTDFGTIIQSFIPADQNDITRVQPGTNITTGGTGNNPTVNLVDSPSVNNLSSSGLTLANAFSANTVSGGTFYSGSTSLETIIQSFVPPDQNDITRVQPGTNILTGGTGNNPTVNLVDSPSINNLTASGLTLSNTFSANTVSGGTFFSGSTPLQTIIQNLIPADQNDITRVQPGVNILTGGTGNNPTVNLVASPSVNDFSASGLTLSNSFSANTISGGTIYSGSTDLYNIFATSSSSDVTRVQPGSNILTGGTDNFPSVSVVASPSVDGLSFSGSAIGNSLSANSVSANTFYSGSTDLYNIFATSSSSDVTRVQPGSNIQTGGTDNFPAVNLIDSPSINGLSFSGTAIGSALSATTLSGGSIFSGSTSLETIIQSFIQPDQNDITRVQPGTNIITGGTGNNPTVNLVDSPSVDGISFSGTAIGSILSANTISGITAAIESRILLREVGTISAAPLNFGGLQTEDFQDKTVLMYSDSGGTVGRIMRDSLFVARNATGSQIDRGKFITITGSTGDAPNIALAISNSDLTNFAVGVAFEDIADNDFGYVMRGGLLTNFNTSSYASGDILYLSTVSPGDFITSKPQHPHFSQILGTILVSGVGNGSIDINTLTPSETFYSGNTFYITSGLSVATSVSAATYYSGTTPLEQIIQSFIPPDQNDITRVQPGTNILTGGTDNFPTVNLVANPSINNLTASGLTLSNTFSANTVSGGTIYSGSTDLSFIFQPIGGSSGDVTRVQPGANILTGGTDNFPTVNLVASPSVNNLTASGLTLSNTFSANTVSGGTIYSGSTDLSFIFQPIGGSSGDVTRVQPGSNILTGGTDNEPIVSLVSSPSVDGISFSGLSIGSALSANTLSGGTIFSGSTNLSTIINTYVVDAGGNLWSAGTGSNAVIQRNLTNLARGLASIAAGQKNTVGNGAGNSGRWSNISGGYQNQVFGEGSVVAGGASNKITINGNNSSILGGGYNYTSGNYSIVGGGRYNSATTTYSSIFGGHANRAAGTYSFIGNGVGNRAFGQRSSITNGNSNSAETNFSSVINGLQNRVSSTYSSILNGKYNLISGNFSSVFGGSSNTVSGINSAIGAGSGLTNSYNETFMATNLTANTVSGGTIFSGSTNIGTLFGSQSQQDVLTNQMVTKANLSGATFTGLVNGTVISATTLSATTTVFDNIKIPTSPTNGYVLTSDANGNGTWLPVGAASSTKLDLQGTGATNTVTATGTLVTLFSVAAKNLGAVGTYRVSATGVQSNNNNGGNSTFILTLNDTDITGTLRNLTVGGAAMNGARISFATEGVIDGVNSGDVFSLKMSASTGTLSVYDRSMMIQGILTTNVQT
jgi:hypothetical protein